MKVYSKICSVIFNVLKWIVAITLIFMVLLTFVEVVRRYCFHHNWIWSEVLVRYLIVYCTFLGGAAAYRVGSLTNFDMITQKLSKRTQRILEFICTIIIVVLAAWLTYKGIQSFNKPSVAKQMSLELGISVRWVYLSIPMGFFALVLFAIERFGHLFKEIKDDHKSVKGVDIS